MLSIMTPCLATISTSIHKVITATIPILQSLIQDNLDKLAPKK